jgi:hypothetical protein
LYRRCYRAFNVSPLEFLKTLIPKCFRRRVWETRRSVATGWELLSHFSDVWCSSLLQLTRSSSWQRESLFRCQIWPHWTYVECTRMCVSNESMYIYIYMYIHI